MRDHTEATPYHLSSASAQPPPSQTAALKPTRDAATTLILAVASLLFTNGQTTEKLAEAIDRLADKLGVRVSLFPAWGELTLRFDDADQPNEILAARPANVEMRKVAAAMRMVDQLCAGRLNLSEARATLGAITQHPPVPTAAFALMAAAGAASLGVLFGVAHPLSLGLIALSAGAGAYLRRWLAGQSSNLFVQPFGAALLAGGVGAVTARWHLSTALQLVAACPCMVLVPGPHLLNGAMDLARARVPLGLARLTYSGLIVLMICAGLLVGLASFGMSLPEAGAAHSVSLGYDLIAAGVVVAAYGTFFSLPWGMFPAPILAGMCAHACHWWFGVKLGASVATSAFVACLVAGTILTLVTDRLRLPFAGLGFASVVSLIPGVFLFRLAGGLAALVQLGTRVPAGTVAQVVSDGATAALVIVAMAFGLCIPKFGIEHFRRR